MFKQEKGVTLVALVITIIVLLILAGVSIAMLTGDNGILTRANDAKSKNSKAEVLEKVNMELNAQLANAMAGYDFDTESAMVRNLGGSSEGSTVTISGYTVTPQLTEASGETKASVKITISGSTASDDFAVTEGTVSYDTTSKIWKTTPVKAK